MDLSSPKECQFGFLRAKFNRDSYPKHFDIDLFFYSGKTLSHYTDLHGLYGIVESGGFWLSDHRFLNDTEEFENGRKLTSNLLERMANIDRHKTFSSVLKETIVKLSGYSEQAYYVCSFSKRADSLDQWKSYANNGHGISITFNNYQKKPSSHFFVMPIMAASKVLYEDSDKVKILIRTIRRYESEYIKDIEHGNHIDLDDWSAQLAQRLAMEFINFKHPEYSSEEEIRMAVPTSYLHHFKGIKHRPSTDRIIPYITSKDIYDIGGLGEELLPISEIRVGPAINQDMTVRSIQEYMENKGYASVSVIKSNVPYRG